MGRTKNLLRLTAMLTGFLPGACAFPKHLDYGSMQSSALARAMDFAVYTPPGWSSCERLPLVIFLHGGGDSVDCFDRAGIAPVLDFAIRTGRMPRALICIPQGDRGFWEKWHDGSLRYRDWVMNDLIPHVQETYNTLTGRQHLHLTGISMGGHGALRFALTEPHSFASIAAISAPVMNTAALIDFADSFFVRLLIPVESIWGPTSDVARVRRNDLFERWQKPADLEGIRFLLAYGSRDRGGIIMGNQRFHSHLERHNIPHHFLEYEGAHKWVDWRPILPDVLASLIDPTNHGLSAVSRTPRSPGQPLPRER